VSEPARILVVEDEDAIREPLLRALASAGHAVAGLAGSTGFEAELDRFRPDLLLLDVMLPGGRDGFTLAAAARSWGDVPVLLLTARDAVEDRLRGFEAGADDYVIKPFVVEELLARVRAVLRRSGRGESALQVADLVVDEEAGAAHRDGRPLDLTATELRLLAYLVRQRGRTVSKTVLLTQVWGYDDYDPNLVEVHVSALRRKTEAYGPRLLHTARGLGYVVRG